MYTKNLSCVHRAGGSPRLAQRVLVQNLPAAVCFEQTPQLFLPLFSRPFAATRQSLLYILSFLVDIPVLAGKTLEMPTIYRVPASVSNVNVLVWELHIALLEP